MVLTTEGEYVELVPFGKIVHVERMYLPDPTPDNHVETRSTRPSNNQWQHLSLTGARHMPKRPMPKSIDEYIATSPPEVQPLLKKIRKTIRDAAPQAEETISYGMPAFKQRGVLVYFAAFKKHIGLYPPVRGDANLMREAAPFAGDKGNLKFLLKEAIPYALIRRIVKSRVLAEQSKT